MCLVKWDQGFFFLISFCLRLCVLAPYNNLEEDSISLWILELRICRSWRLTIVVCIVTFVLAMIIMGGELHIYQVFAENLSLHKVNLNICTFRFWASCEE